MFRMLLRSRRYAGQFFKRRSWDLSTPPKVPNPYGAGYSCVRWAGARACTQRRLYGGPSCSALLRGRAGFLRRRSRAELLHSFAPRYSPEYHLSITSSFILIRGENPERHSHTTLH